ncbi:MAG: protein-L-isoaspartate(D-aspartate) O-methyltransferase [Candidatus Latescibacteria bacterium]|nr:protein-L-isoaspartate(D-aspartate) O-methyltransferase [Candidatus Latescibacterota bacterium]
MNFEKLRRRMVATQIESRGIRDERVLEAMRTVPRHRFVVGDERSAAYEDRPLSIGRGQTISQPYMVALMTACLKLRGGEKVLEIGTGSGYQTAVLAEIAGAVHSVERHLALSEQAAKRLSKLGYDRCILKVGDGTVGWPEAAPFDGIIVTAGAPEVPEALREQLADGGRLVIPVGAEYHQMLYEIRRDGARFVEKEVTGCVFVPLIGEYGWER